MRKIAIYFFYHYLGDRESLWAQDKVDTIFWSSIKNAWLITIELINSAPSINALYYIGAGQLEILVRDYFQEIKSQLISESITNNNLICAMTNVWLREDSPHYVEFEQILSSRLNERKIKPDNAYWELTDLPEEISKAEFEKRHLTGY